MRRFGGLGIGIKLCVLQPVEFGLNAPEDRRARTTLHRNVQYSLLVSTRYDPYGLPNVFTTRYESHIS